MTSPTDPGDELPDRYHALYFNMFFQGISNLLPWNVLIYAYRYFQTRLIAVPEAENFIYYFTIIFMSMKFIFLLSGISVIKHVRPYRQIGISILANGFVFVLITAACALDVMPPRIFYYAIMVLVLLGALFSSFVEAGFLTVLTFFPAKYTQAYLVGHGFAGVFGAVLHIGTALGSESAITTKFAEMYFGITAVVIFMSVYAFHAVYNLEIFKIYYDRGLATMAAKKEAERQVKKTGIPADGHSTTVQLFWEISDLFFTVLIITMVNILVSPTLIIMTESTHYGTSSETRFHKYFFHVTAFLISSIFDLFGKVLPGISILIVSKMPFILIAVGRVLLLPILLFGNIRIEHFKLPYEPLLANDWLFMIIVAIKALTGGYLGTLCMMWTIRVKPMDRGKAVALMVYAIGIGLLVGALISLVLKKILESVSIPL
jgi:equilibrative nucleoside transporter 1/2/3